MAGTGYIVLVLATIAIYPRDLVVDAWPSEDEESDDKKPPEERAATKCRMLAHKSG